MVAHSSRLLRLSVGAALIAACFSAPAISQPVTQPFTFSMVPHTMPLVNHGTTALGDVDNDGDLDVFLSGLLEDAIVTSLFINEGSELREGVSTFVFEDAEVDFPPLVFGSAAWGDYDNDGDLDLVVTGSRTAVHPYDPVSVLFRNDDGALVMTDEAFPGYHSGPAIWADYDNDGDLDLLLGGAEGSGGSSTMLFRNDGGTFVDSGTALPGSAYGSAAFGDTDADGDLDLVLSGIADDGIFADVFLNQGGTFSLLDAGLGASIFGNFDWGDFDADGDLDLVQSGGRLSTRIFDGLAHVYRNSNNTFEAVSLDLPGALSGVTTWGDYDSDGDLDLLLMGGRDPFGSRTAEVFENEAGNFTRKLYFIGAIFGSASWGDLEGDGDLDLLTSGLPTQDVPIVNLYENRRQVVTEPAVPSGLAAAIDVSSVRLSWDAESGGSYNVRVGTGPGASDVVAPMADPETGRRLLAGLGNANQNRSWTIRGLDPGTYYWSVQGLDHSYSGSRFAPEQSFTVSAATSVDDPEAAVPLRTLLHPPVPNPSPGMVTLRYDLKQRSSVVIRVHDMIGRQIATLVNAQEGPGSHRVVWDGRSASGADVSSGVYVCSFQAGTHRQTFPFVVAR